MGCDVVIIKDSVDLMGNPGTEITLESFPILGKKALGLLSPTSTPREEDLM